MPLRRSQKGRFQRLCHRRAHVTQQNRQRRRDEHGHRQHHVQSNVSNSLYRGESRKSYRHHSASRQPPAPHRQDQQPERQRQIRHNQQHRRRPTQSHIRRPSQPLRAPHTQRQRQHPQQHSRRSGE